MAHENTRFPGIKLRVSYFPQGANTWSGRFTRLQEIHLDSPSKMEMCIKDAKKLL